MAELRGLALSGKCPGNSTAGEAGMPCRHCQCEGINDSIKLNKTALVNAEQALPVDIFRQVLGIVHQRRTLWAGCDTFWASAHTFPSRAQLN